MPLLLQLQKLLGKGDGGCNFFSLCVVFWLTSRWKKCILGHPTAWATGYCLLPDTFWLWASKNDFIAGGVKFTNSLSLPSTVKKVPFSGSKAAKGLKPYQAKVKGVNNPAWTAQQCSVSLTRVLYKNKNMYLWLLRTWNLKNKNTVFLWPLMCRCTKRSTHKNMYIKM